MIVDFLWIKFLPNIMLTRMIFLRNKEIAQKSLFQDQLFEEQGKKDIKLVFDQLAFRRYVLNILQNIKIL